MSTTDDSKARLRRRATLCCDIENFVRVDGQAHDGHLLYVLRLLLNTRRFLQKNHVDIRADSSMACVAHNCEAFDDLAKCFNHFGIQLQRPRSPAPAETCIENHLKNFFEVNSLWVGDPVIIMSGDGDVLPSIALARSWGREAWIIASERVTHPSLKEGAGAVTKFIPLSDFMTCVRGKSAKLPRLEKDRESSVSKRHSKSRRTAGFGSSLQAMAAWRALFDQ